MDNRTFQTRLAQWPTMPGDIEGKEYFMSVYPAPLDTKFHALSALYLEGSPHQQMQLTQFFTSGGCAVVPQQSSYARFDNALIYMRRVSRCIETVAHSSFLHLGLAAAAYTEGRVDSHDLLVSLAFLYHAATRAGINPVPAFDAVAATAGARAQEALRAFLYCEAWTPRRMVQHYEGTC